MKIAIIGSGLGGLLSGAKLAQSGHKVEIFETLEVAGGRFINLNYKGHTLSSGALHMIPHGEDGPLGQLLKELNADVNIVNSEPGATIAVKKDDGIEIISFTDATQLLSFRSKIKLAALGLQFKISTPRMMSFKEWSDRHIPDELFAKTSVAFCGWALSVPPEDVSAVEMKAIIENIDRYGGPGVPIGGCSAIINALVRIIEDNGGVIHTGTGVQSIETSKVEGDDGKTQTCASGIRTDAGDVVDADIVISDIGHPETVKLAGSDTILDLDGVYMQKVTSSKSSAGIKICISSNEPLVGHSNILMTPYARRINGMNEVTQIDPTLAPAGKHLIVTHQTML
ncbi:MAG: NAD(P)/FAD-dependent oxidoreductase, partial [Methanosarcinales archaeon]|nr:NAD(P)/FAD-dependent oxidoreductase [Methanosarcinales archaeon]